jgi:hypothetical protein
VDDANVEEALLTARPEVLDDELLHLSGVEQMQVQVPIYWKFNHFLIGRE